MVFSKAVLRRCFIDPEGNLGIQWLTHIKDHNAKEQQEEEYREIRQ